MAFFNVEKTMLIAEEYLKSTNCKEWKQNHNTIEWYRSRFRVRLSLEERMLSDLEELLAFRKDKDSKKENDIWYACFEVFSGITAARPYQQQTAEYCETIQLDPCFVQFGFDDSEVVIKAAFPIIDNPITSDTLHLVEHISSQIIEAHGETLDALAHGHFPSSVGKRIAIPFDAKPASSDVIERAAVMIRSFLDEYEAYSFIVENSKNGFPYWKGVVQLGHEKAVSCISFTETGLLKIELHLDLNSKPIYPRQRVVAAQLFQYEWDERWPAFVWCGSDDEPPMVYAFASLLDGDISEKTVVELENSVTRAYKDFADVAYPVIKGFSSDRHINYMARLHAQEFVSNLKQLDRVMESIHMPDDDIGETLGGLMACSPDEFESDFFDSESE